MSYSGYSNIASTRTFTTKYQDILDALSGVAPASSVQVAHNDFIRYLQGNNSDARDVWSKITCLIPFGAGMPAAADALIWWNNPARTASLSATVPTYAVKKGFTGNALSSYIDSGFNPSIDGGGIYTQSSSANGYYFYNNRTAVGAKTGGGLINAASPYPGIQLTTRNTDSRCYYKQQGPYTDIVGGFATNNLFITNRVNATQQQLFVNKTGQGLAASNSVALQNENVILLSNKTVGGAYAGYTDDTVGLYFSTSGLDQTDVDVINDAWAALLDGIVEEIYYSADGTTLDTSLFTVVNGSTAVATFQQNDAIIINALSGSAANYWLNYIYTPLEYPYCVFKFSGNFVLREAKDPNIRWGITDSTKNNRVEFYKTTTGGDLISFQIISAGAQVYTVDTSTKDFGQFKIVTAADNTIKVYEWINDAWSQVGVTQTYDLRARQLYFATTGACAAIASFRDIHVTTDDYSTLNPA